MIDADILSFGGARDLRVNVMDVCKAVTPSGAPTLKPDDICLGLLVTNIPPDPKNYLRFCVHHSKHGDFGSAIHVKTCGLRSAFHDVSQDLIDNSHYKEKPEYTRPGGKGGKGGKGSKRDFR